MLHMCDSEKSF